MGISTAFCVPALCLGCTIDGYVTVGGGDETGTRVWPAHCGLDVCCVRIVGVYPRLVCRIFVGMLRLAVPCLGCFR
jgi:hypothetical protein